MEQSIMNWLYVALGIIQVISLGALAINVFEFKRLVDRRMGFLDSIQGGIQCIGCRPYRSVWLWIYILWTIGISCITTYLFVYQPHIL